MKRVLISLFLAVGFATSVTAQSTWYVPDDFPTIQDGINGSANGDTVIVRDGTYFENINFNGKAIHLQSENGPATTIIDGMANGTEGVMFNSGEGSDSIFEGFTVTNCLTGINQTGAGIGVVTGSSPIIRGNHILNNTRSVPSGRTAVGSGCSIQGDGTVFEFNVVEGNTTIGTHTWGGGLSVGGTSQGVIVRNNLFVGNSALSWPGGGGINVNESSTNAVIENNTIFGNTAYNGGGICVDYRSSGTVMRNNIVWGNTGGPNIETGGVSTVEYSCVDGGIGGVGNIAADPMLVDPVNGDFQLQAGSPCIDAGDSNSPLDPDGTTADMGAYYFPQAGLDSDSDGISDLDEATLYFTDPFDQDTDDDGLSDGEEINGSTTTPPGTGWILNPANGHYYKEFVVPGHTWHGAVAEAAAMGGYLACIADAAENQWLEATFPPRGGQQETFLGGTDENQEGVWEWITGEPWSYANWAPGEPNNLGGEDYLEWYGSWNDVPNSGYPSGSGTPYGITEFEPSTIGSNPLAFDSDGDGLSDGQEVGIAVIVWDGSGISGVTGTDPLVFVADADPMTTTNPLAHDTDGGGASDGNEDWDKDGAVGLNEGDPNDPLDDLFQLSILGMSPGQQATISVWDCRPGSVVIPLFSGAGQSSQIFPDRNQLELNLSAPINQLNGMPVGPGGTAFSTIWVPPYVQVGRTVYWQAVEVTGGNQGYRPSIPVTAVVL